MLRLKRVFDAPSPDDGYRVYVDRFWPRDLSEKQAKVDLLLNEVAPSAALHQIYGEDPGAERWDEFERRYREELRNKHKSIKLLGEKSAQGTVTLLHAAHDATRNGAMVLKRYLEELTAQRETSG